MAGKQNNSRTRQESDGGFSPLRSLGRYELIARIGKGGMAEVYLARQHGLMGFEKAVVVKCIHEHLSQQQGFINMLLDEARIAARVKHPSVVDIYDLGRDEDIYFIAMEHLAGQPLLDVLRVSASGDPIDVRSAVRIVADVADGLHAAHELTDNMGQSLELVHRDVTPGNIIVLYTGQVKIVDFGIAKARGRLAADTGVRNIKGKLGYLSPEQIRHATVDRRSDIFSLGVVLWEALTLRRLFREKNPVEAIEAVMNQPIEPPSTYRSEVPRKLDSICLKALARDRDQRYATCGEFYEELERFLSAASFRPHRKVIRDFMHASFPAEIAERETLLRQVAVATHEIVLPARRETSSFTDSVSIDRQAETTVLPSPGGAAPPEAAPVAKERPRPSTAAELPSEAAAPRAARAASQTGPVSPPQSDTSDTSDTSTRATRTPTQKGESSPAAQARALPPRAPVPTPAPTPVRASSQPGQEGHGERSGAVSAPASALAAAGTSTGTSGRPSTSAGGAQAPAVPSSVVDLASQAAQAPAPLDLAPLQPGSGEPSGPHQAPGWAPRDPYVQMTRPVTVVAPAAPPRVIDYNSRKLQLMLGVALGILVLVALVMLALDNDSSGAADTGARPSTDQGAPAAAALPDTQATKGQEALASADASAAAVRTGEPAAGGDKDKALGTGQEDPSAPSPGSEAPTAAGQPLDNGSPEMNDIKPEEVEEVDSEGAPTRGQDPAAAPDSGNPSEATVPKSATRRKKTVKPRRPEEAAALYDQGIQAYVKGNLGTAEAKFRGSLDADAGFAKAYRGLGTVYAKRGDKRRAARAFRNYLRLAPSAPDRASITQRLTELEK